MSLVFIRMPNKNARYTYAHQKARKEALAIFVEGTRCPFTFCNHAPMYSSPEVALSRGKAAWQGRLALDHVVPVVYGGMNGPTRLTHKSCNEKSGQLISAKRKHQLGVKPRRGKAPKRQLPKW